MKQLTNEPWLNPLLDDIRGFIFIDVGANCGDFTEWASARFANVVAFEPDLRAFRKLESRARCNVFCWQRAVAAVSGKGRLGVGSNSLQSRLGMEAHPFGHTAYEHHVDVDVISLADYGVSADWIKIDVEGGEPDVIAGMSDNRANLIVECHGNQIDVEAALRAKGYSGRMIVMDHPLPGADPGHCWMIVEGTTGFKGQLAEVLKCR